jgi:glycosyltransferase involved in cell wall biosynthesis
MRIGYLMQAGVPDVRQGPLSGPANHVRQVVVALRKLGHKMLILAILGGRIWKSDDLEDFEPVDISWFDQGPLRLFESGIRRTQSELKLPYAALFESFHFALACRQALSGCDLFYERMGWMGYGGGLAARWLKIPLVLEVNGDHLDEMEILGIPPRGLQRFLSITIMKKAVQQASHVVATGDGWRGRIVERWGVSPCKVTVVENGSQFVDFLSRGQLRSFQPFDQLPLETTIIYIGGFEPWHGLDVLLRATTRAISHGAQIRLLLVGSGSQRAAIEKLIEELNIQNQVFLTGYLPVHELAVHLAKADIGVSPYCGRVEYSGLKLLDYKSAGLATIASGENGQPSVIEHGRTGWIVPPCDEQALSEAIIQLTTNTGLRQEIGRRARIEAENCHGWRNTAMQLEDLFTQVMA